MCARPDNDVTRGEMSINTYADCLNALLRQEGEHPADYATAQHYFVLGVMPIAAFQRILDARREAAVASKTFTKISEAGFHASLGALAGAADDLHRAALILRQIAAGTSERIGRGPQDYRRIAAQFSDRAQACAAVGGGLAQECREGREQGTP